MKLNPYLYKSRRESSKSKKNLMIILCILIFIAFALGCYVVYFTFFMPKNSENPTPSPVIAPSLTIIPTSENTPSDTETENPAPTQTPEVILRSVFVPENILTNSELLINFILEAQTAGANGFIIEIKNSEGYLLYNSKLQSAVDMQTITQNPADLIMALQHIKDSGSYAVAKMSCFKDKLAPRSNLDMAVSIKKNYIWLDESGDCWLNPYSTEASQYLYDIAVEAFSMGFSYILLDNIEFPSTGILSQIDFNADKSNKKSDALTAFINGMNELCIKNDGKALFMLDTSAFFGKGNSDKGHDFDWQYFDENIIFAPYLPSADYSALCPKAIYPNDFAETLDILSLDIISRFADYKIKFSPIIDGSDTYLVNKWVLPLISNGMTDFILLADGYSFDNMSLNFE